MRAAVARLPRVAAGLGLVLVLAVGPADVALAATPSPSPSPSASGASGQGPTGPSASFSIQPFQAKGTGARGIFSYNATPGGLVHDKATVINNGAVPLTLRIQTADALNTAEGAFGVTGPEVESVDAGAWISIPKKYRVIELPARTGQQPPTVTFPLTVRIPTNATPGDHIGAVLAVLDTKGVDGSGPSIDLKQRVGSRMFIRVVGDLKPELTVSDVHAGYTNSWNPVAAGSASVTYTVTNSGNVGLGGIPQLSVEPILGPTARAQGEALPLLLPGSSVTRTTTVTGVWPLLLEQATVTVEPLLIPGSVQPDTHVVTAGTTFWAMPWVWLLILAAAALAFWVYRRRRADAQRPPGPGGPPPIDPGPTDGSPTPKAISDP